jgi:hypothetical protein
MVYAPGTLETDQKKQNMALQQQASAITSATADIATNAANIATNAANIATNTANIATNTASIAAMQAAWTAYTPTVSATSGTLTSASASGRYLAIGKTVFVTISITITTNGTGATAVQATLPVNASTSLNQSLVGRENSATGKMLQGRILAASNTVVGILNYDNSYPGVDGALLNISGVYERS